MNSSTFVFPWLLHSRSTSSYLFSKQDTGDEVAITVSDEAEEEAAPAASAAEDRVTQRDDEGHLTEELRGAELPEAASESAAAAAEQDPGAEWNVRRHMIYFE